MATIDLGKLGFVNKGTYNNSTTYEKNDLVQFTDGGILSTYLYIDNSAQSGQAPSSSGTAGSRWVYFAKGVADSLASAGNNKVIVTNASGQVTPLAIGSASQALKVNSSANGFEFGETGGGLQSQQVFTSSGTYTKPSGINKIKVIVTGAGGGGGSGSGSNNHGGGGGAGGTAIEIIDVSSLSSTVAVTVGTGGTVGSANSSTQGGTGGTSSFGSYCSATGGIGGFYADAQAQQNAGDGGVGSNADINLHGGRGEEHSAQSTQDQSGGGHGGSSYWGGGGRTASPWTTTNATAGEAFGSGGGGGVHDNRAGAVGADGICVVEEYK
jgi:hypothetical protein